MFVLRYFFEWFLFVWTWAFSALALRPKKLLKL